MRPLASEYMAWAKQHQLVQPVRYEMSPSGLAGATAADWPAPPSYEPGGSNTYGDPLLIEALARQYGIASAQVLPVPGGSTLANFMAVACLHQERPVAMESPGYEPLRRMIESMTSVRPLYRTADTLYRVDVPEAEAAFAAGAHLLVLTDLHNPSGATLDIDTLQRLNEAAARHQAWVLVDEIYLDALPGRRPPAAVLGHRLVSTASLTKVYGLGALRCGWLMASPEVIQQARGWSDTLYGAGPAGTERVAAQALGRLDAFRARYDRIVTPNQAVIEAWLDRHPDIRCLRPPAGLMYFVSLPPGVGSHGFDERLRQHYDTGTAPGHFFGEPGAVRLGIGMIDTGVLQEGLRRLGEAWQEAASRPPES